ncbi:MAG: DUF533 domain-containing protein [Pseudomonadota bacterium]
MFNFEKVLADLQEEAAKVAEAVELERRVEQGKAKADDLKERLETDPQARMVAAGAGGLLLAGLLGTNGGRKLIGGVAKTGAVAALGALAYRTWQGRQEPTETEAAEAMAAGYVGEATASPEFSEAIVRIMVAAAQADGVIDEAERMAIDTELQKLGTDADERAMLTKPVSEEELFDAVVPQALSPNHAAQLYAAASVVAGVRAPGERAFLKRLADRLGVDHRHAAAMDGATG